MTDDSDKDSQTTKNLPHDALFKRIMESNIAAKEFLNEYLPDEVKEIVDLSSIKVQKESYIEPNLTKRLSDIVYRGFIRRTSICVVLVFYTLIS